MHSCFHSLSIFFVFTLFFSLFSTFVYATFDPITKPIISFCAGYSHSCAVFDDKQMKCWGAQNSYGALMNYGETPSTVGDNIPYFNPGISLNITQVTCLNYALCILLNTGDIKCAGENSGGILGLGMIEYFVGEKSGLVGDNLPVIRLGTGVKISSIASGIAHVCALTEEGKVKCFGLNEHGQLGLGDTVTRGGSPSDMGNNLPYIKLGEDVKVASVHSGPSASHSCAILSKPTASAQRIKCWGHNDKYQLGYGDTKNRGDKAKNMGEKLPLIDLGNESKVKQLSFGWEHTCALLANDLLKCFGGGISGALGSGSTADIASTGDAIPSVTIDQGKTIKFVSAGVHFTCIVYDDQVTLKCFGYNNFGQLGQGDQLERGNTPTTMIPFIPAILLGTGSLKITSINSGGFHNCIIFEDKSVKCFGYNSNGELALGNSNFIGPFAAIGDGANEMGSNLEFAELFSQTKSPTAPTPPTSSPTTSPVTPTLPTTSPSKAPIKKPTKTPTKFPTKFPVTPTLPTTSPSKAPTQKPSKTPTKFPVKPSKAPTKTPSKAPTNTPTKTPTKFPVTPTLPTKSPSKAPTPQQCSYKSAKLCKKDPACAWKKVAGKFVCTLIAPN